MNPDERYLKQARQVLSACLDLPELAEQIGDDDSFLSAGVNSGEMIQVIYQCEQLLGLELEEEEVMSATSIREVAVILQDHAGDGPHVA